ncbi:F0F1 ATP synthase subunit A [Paenibacillus sediminis]|uniref:ATP synthase subunit a n=1 Tax=Paenibacillus sediminis TaxID=664909 RepID=A0ABS4H2E0_9BACL|nr:F0F1 ATP synthase subunit A [Paenibacillus sediminis]MBP1936703.1 F-type H+-transporting ATPase subunit a [Paenibacillus sediminis]
MHEAPIIQLGGLNIDLSIVLMLIVSCIVVFIIARLAVRNLSVENPGKMQNFLEWLVEFVRGLSNSTMDWKKGKPFISLALTLIMFIFVSNMLGLPFGVVTGYHDASKAEIFGKPIVSVTETLEKLHQQHPDQEAEVEVAWWKSPTADANASMALAIMVFLLSHALGIFKNTKAYFKHYVHPYPFFLPINLIETFSKPLTHGMRLFGNIFAGEVLIAVILKLTSLGPAGGVFSVLGLIVWQGFSIFVGTIQAFVFTMLTLLYISQTYAVGHDHD